jgi:hypothetical protein
MGLAIGVAVGAIFDLVKTRKWFDLKLVYAKDKNPAAMSC